MAAESPTRTLSTPAASASRALGASYAVTIAILPPRSLMRAKSDSENRSSDMIDLFSSSRDLQAALIELNIVDETRRADACRDRQGGMSIEVSDRDVLGVDTGQHRTSRRNGIGAGTVGSKTCVERARNRQRPLAFQRRQEHGAGGHRATIAIAN